ncbi:MAG: diguanylate cyclase domain-containing protein [Deltaproteobacteria bacterium]
MFKIEGYTLKEKIFESSNSVVCTAERALDKKLVVAKILAKTHPTNEEIAKFCSEFKLCAGFSSENIIKMYDVEKCDNTYAIIMEYFEGESLNTFISRNELDIKEFLEVAIKITEVLGEVHNKNVIHKDINPSNILFNQNTKKLIIIDFGIATQLSRETQWSITPTTLEGTITYISPEQTGRMNRVIDYRSDYYSLGMTLYELITRKKAFEVEDPVQMIHYHIAKMPTPPHEIDKNIPQPISNIIQKLISKNAEDRYQSNYGILADLQECYDQLKSKGEIGLFDIGKYDVFDRFELSQKLYGRENEIKILLEGFKFCIDNKTSRMILVSGYSGIGKSSLVNEIQKPIVEKRGYFISGKFDQLNKDVPYFSIIQAFKSFINQIIIESSDMVSYWKNRILDAVGTNGKILIDIIPEIKLLIGEQPNLTELQGLEAQNRFNLVFNNFVCSLASKEHPLVIFLDDLQWADSSTLKIIEQFFENPAMTYIYFIGAYRDNEVDSTHPLMLTIEELIKKDKIYHNLVLNPLDIKNVNLLLSDTLKCKSEKSLPLAKLCIQKTLGNPFFLNHFLKTLYNENAIYFEQKTGTWEWDLDNIIKIGLSDNVVDLLVKKIETFSEDSKKILTIAACCGNQFDLKTLAYLNDKSIFETSKDLEEALSEGLIIPNNNNYKYISEEFESFAVTFRFLHDKVQQAAYSIIDNQRIKFISIKLGRFLLSNTPDIETDERLFDTVNSLNEAYELITDKKEMERLVELNLIAGKRAIGAVAYELALRYFTNGIKLIGEEGWKTNYGTTLNLYTGAVEAAGYCTDFVLMDSLVDKVIVEAKTVLDKVKVYESRIFAYISLNKSFEAVKVAFELFENLGIKVPKKVTNLAVLKELAAVSMLLKGKSKEDILNMPLVEDPKIIAIMNILSSLITPVFVSLPEYIPMIACGLARLSLKYGNSNVSGAGYTYYGVILSSLGYINKAYMIGQTGTELVEKLNAKEFHARAYYIYYNFIHFWKHNFADILPDFINNYKIALENGDYEMAADSLFMYCYGAYNTGKNLEKLKPEIYEFNQTIKKLKQDLIVHMNTVYLQAADNLLGNASNPCFLIGEYFNDEKELNFYLETNNYSSLCHIYSNRMILNYIFNNYEDAVENAVKFEKYQDGVRSSLSIILLRYYDSLCHIAIYNESPFLKKKAIIKKVNANLKKLKEWSELGSKNSLHKYYLVLAEKYRILEKASLAEKYYDKAIEYASKYEFLHEEAIANECAAAHYFNKSQEKIAFMYLSEARYCYGKWGALAKVKQLDEKYPSLKPLNSGGSNMSLSVKYTTALTFSQPSESLDFKSLIKASQTISEEISYKKAIDKLIQIVTESAGAGKVVLIKTNGSNYIPEAYYSLGDSEVSIIDQSISGDSADQIIDEQASRAVINYVIRKGQTLVLFDASQKHEFKADKYITENQTKSVLCLPLLHHGEIKRVLYLENNLTKGAFTAERVNILEMLSAQIVISMENAAMYSQLEELVEARTLQLKGEIEERKKAQKMLEEMATHDNLTGLPNRRLFLEHSLHALDFAKRHNSILAILFIDLDGFKKINDTLGHDCGDMVLQTVAQRLSGCVRECDTVSRLGGDEFTIVLEKVNDAINIKEVCQRIIEEIGKPISFGNVKEHVTPSIGISIYPYDGDDKEELIKKADNAMYKAKNSGKNKFLFHNEELNK